MLFEDILDSLFTYFNVSSIGELSKKLGVSQPAISKWKSRNAINPIKKKCRELGIYQDIFGDTQINDFRKSSLDGNATGINNGNQTNVNNISDINDINNCDHLTKELIKKLCELYKDNQLTLQTKLFGLISDADESN